MAFRCTNFPAIDTPFSSHFFCISNDLCGFFPAVFRGSQVNIASISGKDGNAGMLAYSSSKAGNVGNGDRFHPESWWFFMGFNQQKW